MMRKCGKKKLTRLVLAALLSTGGALFSPQSVASAADVTVGENDTVDDVHYIYNGAINDTDIWTTPPTGEQSGHTATISGTVANDFYGGYSSDGPANNNQVLISGNKTYGSIWAGSGVGATGNVLTITGSPSFGAFSAVHGAAGNGDMTNNTVNILSRIVGVSLVGGESYDGGASTGNTLNIAAVGVEAPSVGHFQNMNFFFPKDTKAKDVMLTVKNDYDGDLDLTGVTFGALAQAGFSLAKDETVTLIKYEAGGEFKADDTPKVAEKAAVLAEAEKINAIVPKSIVADEDYEFAITKGDKEIVATVTNVSEKKDDPDNPSDDNSPYPISDRKKSAIETRAAALTFLNAGADMLASQGFSEAANAVAIEMAENAKNGTGAQPVGGFTPFAAFGGSSLRAESGSHVDTKGFGLNVGFAREIANSQGKLLFGPVIEYGGGNYDSYNNNIHADGGSHYWGIGLMARQVNHDGFYYEGSLRGGRVKADYTERSTGLNSTYDSSSNYWAAHLGLGKVVAAGKSNTVDAYLKYFYSHQSGDDVTITSINPNAPVQANFDSVDSNRIRIGARLTHKVNEMNSFYGGRAYQYEFSGDARAHFNGEGAPSPSVKGSSGLLELGWQVKPGGPLMLDLGVTGWAGKQRGGSVQLGATWSF